MLAISFNEFPIERVLSWQEEDSQRVAQEQRPRRHARLAQNSAWRGFKRVTLVCEADRDTEDALDTYMENLKGVVTSSIGNLRRRDNGRYLKAILSSWGAVDEATRLPGLFRRFTLEFQCEPHWYGSEQIESFASQESGSNNVVVNGGKATAPPRIEVTGPVGADRTITITNTTIGMSMTFRGNFVAGQSVVFDHVHRTVLRSGVEVMDNIETPNFWELVPGTNNIRYDGDDTADIAVSWVERWP